MVVRQWAQFVVPKLAFVDGIHVTVADAEHHYVYRALMILMWSTLRFVGAKMATSITIGTTRARRHHLRPHHPLLLQRRLD